MLEEDVTRLSGQRQSLERLRKLRQAKLESVQGSAGSDQGLARNKEYRWDPTLEGFWLAVTDVPADIRKDWKQDLQNHQDLGRHYLWFYSLIPFHNHQFLLSSSLTQSCSTCSVSQIVSLTVSLSSLVSLFLSLFSL